jgi:putative transcription antitermination factor YqgF
MSSYLSIDPGLSHTGIAISDSSHLVEPLTTIHTKDQDKLLKKILVLIKEQGSHEVIIGCPSSGPIRQLSQDLLHEIKSQFSGPVHLFSEDLSSQVAIHKLVSSKGSKKKRQQKKHAAAAAVILQDYLSFHPV